MTCAWVDTSRLLTGSSSTRSFGVERERAGDRDALQLATRELARVPVAVLGAEPDGARAARAMRSVRPLASRSR